MATTNILGLFTSPEQYQAQQLAQQQADERARAINFANLDPRGQANYGVFLGAQQLGRGFAGLLGVQDPQLQRIRQRQEIMQSINPADLESLMGGIQRASQMGDQELALTLTDFMNEQGSKMALARQRQAQADRERVQSQSGGIQEAARIRQIVLDQANLDPESNEYKALEAEKIELQNVVKNKTTDKVQQLKNLYAELDDAKKRVAGRAAPSATVGLDGQAFATRPQVNVEDDPEVRAIQSLIRVATGEKPAKEVAAPDAVRTAEAYADSISSDRKSQQWKDAFQSQFTKKDGVDKDIAKAERIGELTEELEDLAAESGKDSRAYRRKAAILAALKSDKAGTPIKELVLAEEIAKLDAFIRNAKDPAAPEVLDAKAKVDLLRSQLKSDKPNLTVVGEVRSGTDKGKTVYVDENKDQQFIYSVDSTGKQVRKLVSDADVSRLTSQITATASSSGSLTEKTIVKGVAELDVEDLKTARANKKAASASNDSLRQLLSLSDQGLISGSFASGRVGATNLLNTLGILNKTSADNLSRSEQYQKIGADLVFNALQGKLGPGVSEGDRVFITELFPKLENSAAARRELIRYVAEKNNKIISEADAVEAYIRKNPDKGLSGFKSLNSGAFHVPSNKIDLSTMSPQDLKALEQKLLRDKKGGR